MFLMTKSDKKCEHSGVLAEHDIDGFFFLKSLQKLPRVTSNWSMKLKHQFIYL